MASNIIRDGYTRKATINAVPGQYEGLEISYRPMLPEQVDAVSGTMADKRAAKDYRGAAVFCAKALAKHVVEWNEVDPDGKPVPITAENVARLPARLFKRLFDDVSGYDSGDGPTENAPPAERDEYLTELMEATATGKPPAQVTDDADEKN